MREGSPPDRMVQISTDAEGGRVFGFKGDPPASNVPKRGPTPKPKPTRRATIDAAALLAECRSKLTAGHRGTLAGALGLPGDAVAALRPGWADRATLRAMSAGGAGWRDDYPDGAFVFAESDAQGQPVGLSLRTLDGRKGFAGGLARGLTLTDDPLPDRGPVLLVEGASDVAAAHALGFAAVGRSSNRGGVEHAAGLFASSGADLIVVGENDAKPDGRWPGLEGARAVAEALAAKLGRPIRWAMPPDGCKDLRELFTTHGDDARATLQACIDDAETAHPPSRPRSLEPEPFPIDALPEVLRTCAESHALALNTDPAAIAAPMLVVLASAVSASRAIDLGRGYQQPLVLWGALVGAPSDGKSPALDVAAAPVRQLTAEQAREHREASKQYLAEIETHKLAHSRWTRTNKDSDSPDPPPDEPEAPQRRRASIGDATPGAIHQAMIDNGGSLLLERDELAAVLESFGKFDNARGGGGDAEALCQCWSGAPWDVARLGRDAGRVDRACLSIVGGLTRGTFSKKLFARLAPTGMLARFLLARVPTMPPRRWDDDRPAPVGSAEYARVFESLSALKPGDDGEPVYLTLTPEALTLFADAELRYRRMHAESGDDEPTQAAAGKANAQLGRIAGVLHLVRVASEPNAPDPLVVDADTMRAAVRVADWALTEALALYAIARESEADTEARELLTIIERKGGSITPAELGRLSRKLADADDAREALAKLADAGWGSLTYPPPSESGGRPKSALFRLHPNTQTSASVA